MLSPSKSESMLPALALLKLHVGWIISNPGNRACLLRTTIRCSSLRMARQGHGGSPPYRCKKTKPGQGGYIAGTKSVFFKVVEEGEVPAMAAALMYCTDGASPNAKPVSVRPRTTTIALAQAAPRWPATNAWEARRSGCSRRISQKRSHMQHKSRGESRTTPAPMFFPELSCSSISAKGSDFAQSSAASQTISYSLKSSSELLESSSSFAPTFDSLAQGF